MPTLFCFNQWIDHEIFHEEARRKKPLVKSNGMVTPSPKRHRCAKVKIAKVKIAKLSSSQIGADRAGSDPGCDQDSCDRWRQPCQSVVPADCRPDSGVGKPRGLPGALKPRNEGWPQRKKSPAEDRRSKYFTGRYQTGLQWKSGLMEFRWLYNHLLINALHAISNCKTCTTKLSTCKSTGGNLF